MKVTDQEVREAWIRSRNYSQVGRDLNIARQTAFTRVMQLRARGVDLPPSRPAGYTLTSERAREIKKLHYRKNAEAV